MFLFYALSFFREGDTIQGGMLFKGGHYLRKYGMSCEQFFVRRDGPILDLDLLYKIYFRNRSGNVCKQL